MREERVDREKMLRMKDFVAGALAAVGAACSFGLSFSAPIFFAGYTEILLLAIRTRCDSSDTARCGMWGEVCFAEVCRVGR